MELYQKVFGKYLNNAIKQGENLVIPCLWHSDHNPSLSISTNPDKPVYKCWSCGKTGSLIGAYMELNNVDYKTALKELDMFDENYVKQKQANYVIIPKQKKQTVKVDYSEYCYNVWANTIMHDKHYEFYGKKLYELRGITYRTAVACQIGYDPKKGWIFPFNRFNDNKCTGYEIRQKEFKKFDFNNSKCYKAQDSESCLSIVWRGFDNRKAIVTEGFIDGMKLYQYLHEKAQITENSEFAKVKETILTPTNGVKTIPELVKAVELWNKFDEILFVLDNDPYKLNKKTGKMESPGNDTANELKQLANDKGYNFKFFTGLPEGWDFENLYDRKLKKELT